MQTSGGRAFRKRMQMQRTWGWRILGCSKEKNRIKCGCNGEIKEKRLQKWDQRGNEEPDHVQSPKL